MTNPKAKDDPKQCPWVLASSENRFDVFLDYKYFDLSLSYSNELSNIQEEEYEKAFLKHSKGEKEISAYIDKTTKIGYGTDTKLGEVYFNLTKNQLTENEIN